MNQQNRESPQAFEPRRGTRLRNSSEKKRKDYSDEADREIDLEEARKKQFRDSSVKKKASVPTHIHQLFKTLGHDYHELRAKNGGSIPDLSDPSSIHEIPNKSWRWRGLLNIFFTFIIGLVSVFNNEKIKQFLLRGLHEKIGKEINEDDTSKKEKIASERYSILQKLTTYYKNSPNQTVQKWTLAAVIIDIAKSSEMKEIEREFKLSCFSGGASASRAYKHRELLRKPGGLIVKPFV
eukprot:CAMPEP_0178951492 /NCGR_PEP_ID=MMETSP0789-20121207/7259_1 /TAXON_ID=3005 /ORGANISM="Rhizosolenia setigera, Strain CCMP 1694" /LENGTH=236 /DNA_ID=CAMNT_0020632377 /DNA_START=345 /DNA_END=1055 /DNA_ORIENTATION=+